MTSTSKKDTDLALRLQDIVHRDERRKHMIQLCVMKSAYLRQVAKNSNNGSSTKITSEKSPTPPNSPPTHPSNSQISGDAESLSKKVQNFELQVTSLKMTLATKEHAHAAKVEELKEEIERLKKEKSVEESSHQSRGKSASLARNRRSNINPRLLDSGSPLPKSSQSVSSFFAPSPFSDTKTGRGNSFSSAGLTSIASKATLKLSKAKPKASDGVFSPNNSSAESTPKKSRKNSKVGEFEDPGEDFSDTLRIRSAKAGNKSAGETNDAPGRNSDSTLTSEADAEKSQNEFSGISLNTTTTSDSEEVYHSANASFESDNSKRPKKRKIRLVSSEASKVLLASQNMGLDGEADANSLKYYQDENFSAGAVSPVPAAKVKVASEQPPKKKHVFRIE